MKNLPKLEKVFSSLKVCSRYRKRACHFVFGPEGGIEEQEVELLEQSGYLPCSLGPRILRAETAPLYALAAVSYQCELL